MEDFDFPTPLYNIGDRVILNPRDRSQYGAEELRFVGKLGVVMPTSKHTADATDIPMVRFDGAYRKHPIAQDDLIPHDAEFVPYKQTEQEGKEYGLCPAEKHRLNQKNVYIASDGTEFCKPCKRDENWERMIASRVLVGA